MITFPPKSNDRSSEPGLTTVYTSHKALAGVIASAIASRHKIKSASNSLLQKICNTTACGVLLIAGIIVATIRRPPVNLPGVTTRGFYLIQWQDDASSLKPGLPRLIYSLARLPDALGIVLTCCRSKGMLHCNQCNRTNQ